MIRLALTLSLATYAAITRWRAWDREQTLRNEVLMLELIVRRLESQLQEARRRVPN